MLWIISVSSTVLPTPAPPNSPALPPRSSGTRTSMTLMPVSKISDLVERRASDGGARCTERHWTSDNAASRSMVLPNTSNIRERTCLCPPALSTARPCPPPPCRARDLAWASTQSRARDAHPLRQHFDDDLLVLPRTQHRVDGGGCSSNRTSTTLPRTETTMPGFAGKLPPSGSAHRRSSQGVLMSY